MDVCEAVDQQVRVGKTKPERGESGRTGWVDEKKKEEKDEKENESRKEGEQKSKFNLVLLFPLQLNEMKIYLFSPSLFPLWMCLCVPVGLSASVCLHSMLYWRASIEFDFQSETPTKRYNMPYRQSNTHIHI